MAPRDGSRLQLVVLCYLYRGGGEDKVVGPAELGPGQPPTVTLQRLADRPATVLLGGRWDVTSLVRGLPGLRRRLAELARQPELRWDLRAIETLDSIGALVLWRSWQGAAQPLEIVAAEAQRTLLDQWRSSEMLPRALARRPAEPLARRLSQRVRHGWEHLRDALVLVGELAADMAYLVRHPREFPWRELSAMIFTAGNQALTVTALVGLLIGVVLSYLFSLQLREFSAGTYIVDVLGIGIIRELGPLLAALLVAGRSGSAMTAQLGAMRITQELDALEALGISTSLRLLLPKVLALIIVVPLLIVWADILALLGGMVAAQQSLGIEYGQFLASLPSAVPVFGFWLGLAKGVVFGTLIALTACHFGLRVEPNTLSLGHETTRAVVAGITQVIIANAVFAVVFQGVGYR